jgi:hypothetical protein
MLRLISPHARRSVGWVERRTMHSFHSRQARQRTNGGWLRQLQTLAGSRSKVNSSFVTALSVKPISWYTGRRISLDRDVAIKSHKSSGASRSRCCTPVSLLSSDLRPCLIPPD